MVKIGFPIPTATNRFHGDSYSTPQITKDELIKTPFLGCNKMIIYLITTLINRRTNIYIELLGISC